MCEREREIQDKKEKGDEDKREVRNKKRDMKSKQKKRRERGVWSKETR